ncbi:MAG: hypothetical protein J1E40_02530 [Oscillospiraceae bacterium]|nr:hypothetical protein [Oscillospiraceae bacterium]
MTINGANFNANSLKAAMGTGAAQNNKTAGNNAPAPLSGIRRYDKLDLSRFGQRYLEASEAEKAQVEQMIREASEMAGYSNFEKASASYWEMKKMIRDEVNRSEAGIKGVEKYQNERKYYQDILDRTYGDKIYIARDRYGWIAAAGKNLNKGYISRSDLMEAMSKAESRTYDKYIGRYTGEVEYEDYIASISEDEYAEGTADIGEILGVSSDELQSRSQEGEALGNWGDILSRKFNKYAKMFSSITNENVPYSGENNSLFSREGLTLDNFIEKTNERIDRLHDTEKALQKAMQKYIRGLKPQDLVPSDNSFLDIKLELFFRELESESEMLADFNDTINSSEEG